MDNIVLKDTFEVFLQDIQTPANVFFLGINTKTDWVKKLSSTILRGGIGNLPKFILQDSNEQEFSVDPLFWGDSLIGILSGTTSASGTATVKVSEKLQVASGAVTVVGTPVGSSATIFDAVNKQYVGAFTLKVAAITSPPADGTWVTIVYDSTVTGNITNLSADKFPKAYKIFAHTIAYLPSTQSIVQDVYLNFYQATCDGNMSASFEGGKEAVLPLKFMLTTPVQSNDFGQYITVPR